ncbi:MAG: DUF92 domain-containing protein [Planctomycetota bacterium]|nr:DUF92 domain-containing protein [Planctomycetota bacterium]
MAVYHESTRQTVKLASLLAAFPMVWIAGQRAVLTVGGAVIYGDEAAAALCMLAAAFVAFILPLTSEGRMIFRPDEGFPSGLSLYPLSLAFAFLLFPPYAVSGAWGVMAAGDTAANVIGRRSGFVRLAWNPRKTIAGSIAFVAAAAPACMLMLAWAGFPPVFDAAAGHPVAYLAVLSLLGAMAGALLESVPWDAGDNFAVPLGSAASLVVAAHAVSYITEPHGIRGGIPPDHLLAAMLLNAGLGLLAARMRLAGRSGAAAGGAVGLLVFCATGWAGYILLVAFAAGVWTMTQFGRARKSLRGAWRTGIGQHGLRGTAPGLAVAVLCAVAYFISGKPEFLAAFAGGLAAALADAASREIGMLSKAAPVLITTGRIVPSGASGGVTSTGHAAALAASVSVAMIALASGLLDVAGGASEKWQSWMCACGVAAGGITGATADSFLGATLEAGSGVVRWVANFAATAAGAAVASLFASAAALPG